ncbi:hypothetical protein MFRU_077g00110 [Monilinia fructicola]|uniref:Uncharacterized protein n=1 Tax=Monilinia fructicola TaxID=38448 RepID=A0A5M9J6W0_MONFR|nr:hypothetical protein EYC84_011166 [Monilinia fructicola]KAG4024944.1 hypothetical protein MFRU_077g00110 [Monilinia fructicola]
MAMSALVSHASPTPVAEPLPDGIHFAHLHARSKSTPTPPTPSLCAQKGIAFGPDTCTFVYEYFGDKATALVVYKDCVIKSDSVGSAPAEVASTSGWNYPLPGCNIVKMNGVVFQNWTPTNQKYFMPLYQSDGQESTNKQRGPSVNDENNPKSNCTLKYDNLSDGAQYAWICPFECIC